MQQTFAVWTFRSVDGRQAVTVAKHYELGAERFQSEYNRISWIGVADNKGSALMLAKASK